MFANDGVQIMFDKDPEASHRRRASVISSDDPDSPHQEGEHHRHHHRADSTTCFVHSLLGRPGNSTAQEAVREATPVQSRLLTKKELSDMAWNVRALSKTLGSIKLKLNVRSVFLVTKQDQHLVKLTREVAQWLLAADREAQYIVFVEKQLEKDKEFDIEGICSEESSAKKRLKFIDLNDPNGRSQTIDFIITMGGDGTVLYSSWLFQHVVPPVLSFALGSLGFLTKFNFSEYPKVLEKAFLEGITVSLRLRLECTIMRSKERSNVALKQHDMVEEIVGENSKHDMTHTPGKTYQILNDIVVDRGPNPSMVPL